MEFKKISDTQLELLRGLQTRYDVFTKRFGELHFQHILIEKEQKDIDTGLRNLESERTTIVESLQKEFGSTGSINLETGEFIPDF